MFLKTQLHQKVKVRIQNEMMQMLVFSKLTAMWNQIANFR